MPEAVLAHEPRAGTFADGSLGDRIVEMIRQAESGALVLGLTRTGKPKVAVSSSRCGKGPHLHMAFLVVPIDIEVP